MTQRAIRVLPGPEGDRDPRLTTAMLARAEALDAVAEDLAGELMLKPLLERILQRCLELVGCDAGSICSVDEVAGVYRKEADVGVRCQVGAVFPLSEGMTGAVVARRAPVWFDRYEDVPGGHISSHDRRTLTSVIGVPLQWRGRIIGVCVAFSRDPGRRFTQADADVMDVFARRAALALANATIHEATEVRARAQAATAERARLLAEVQGLLAQGSASLAAQLDDVEQALRADGRETPLALNGARAAARELTTGIRGTLSGLAVSPLEGRTLDEVLQHELQWAERACAFDAELTVAGPATALEHDIAHGVLRVAQEALANVVQHARAKTVRVGLVYDATAVTLLVQDDGVGFVVPTDTDETGLGLRRMRDRVHGLGGSLAIDSLEGWGTSLRARVPYLAPGRRVGERVRVLVVDPRPFVCAGVGRLLAWSEPALTVVGEAASPEQAAEAAVRLRPDVVVFGVSREVSAGEAIRRVQAMAPSVPVLLLGDPHDDPNDDQELPGGRARSVVEATTDGPTLARAVLSAASGTPVEIGVRPRMSAPGRETLTRRESEVCRLVEQGLPDRAIAAALSISAKTVEKHVASVLHKTGARNRLELLAAAAADRR
jgi:signal transduction histidine kinase/DNA-binding NarL/FixJ family response regulator